MSDQDLISERAEALLPGVMQRIEARATKRRRRRGGLLAAGVLATAGVAIVAATVAPAANPGGGAGVLPGGSVFAIDCSAGPGAVKTQLTFGTHEEANKVVADPAAACASEILNERTTLEVTSAASRMKSTGATCGLVQVSGAALWRWKAGTGQTQVEVSDSPKQPNWPDDCEAKVTIPAIQIDSNFTPCQKASNWAVVYSTAKNVDSDTCAVHGYAPWGE